MIQLVKEITKGLLEQSKKTVAVYGGGFKPPTKGHFGVVKQALDENPEIDEFIIYVGRAERDGVTLDDSLKIWGIYRNYLPSKVKIEKSIQPPIKSIYDYAKEHPDEEVLWVIGAREESETDFADIASRTKSITKYPNLELRTIVTKGGVSGTAARNASKVSPQKLNQYLPDFLSSQEKNNIFVILSNEISEADPKKGTGKKPKGSGRRLYTDEDPSDTVSVKFSTRQDVVDTLNKSSFKSKSHARQSQIINLIHQRVRAALSRTKDPAKKKKLKSAFEYIKKRKEASKAKTQRLKKQKLNEHASYTDSIDIAEKIAELTNHMLDKGMNIEPLPTMEFVDGDSENAKDFFGKTAYYDPDKKHIVLYTEGRHPKDIVRSYAHEMIHHIQNLEGRLGNITTTNTTEDDYLTKLEQEANLRGTMTFRGWTDSIKNNLNEGPQFGTLYHFTQDLSQVISSNTLRGPVSLTRSLDSHVSDWLGDQPLLVLDKDKLRTKYKIRPYKDTTQDPDFEDIEQYDEMEEVIDRDITNLDQYLVKVVLPYPDEIWEEYLKEKNIPYEYKKSAIKERNRKEIYKHRYLKTKDPFGLNAYAAELGRLREDEQDYKIYLDMDGVVADFDQRFRDLSGMAPSEFEAKYGKDLFWDFIDEGDNKVRFWVGIPPMEGAKQLVDYVSKHDYVMLTAPSIKKQSRLGKNLWIRNHTGDIFPSKPKVIFKAAKEKHKVKPSLSEKDILIDDKASTIDNWNAAGGTGILYQSAPQVISTLKKIGL